MNNKKYNKVQFIILLVIILLIILYLLIQNLGYIENHSQLTPTGNVDIFEIECDCCKEPISKEKEKKVNEQKRIVKPIFQIENDIYKNRIEENKIKEQKDDEEEEEDNIPTDITVYDNHKSWNNKELRIFSNPAYEYKSIIAPGSSNSYTFVIRNNTDYDVVVDILFDEKNEKNINMNYKLRNNGEYLIGTEDEYVPITNKRINEVNLEAGSEKTYILDWKWIDNNNDTEIGFNPNSKYKLSISIGVTSSNENN